MNEKQFATEIKFQENLHLFTGIFGKGGEIQTMLCLAFSSSALTYAGTLSGDIYKWNKNNLIGTCQGHEVQKFRDKFAAVNRSMHNHSHVTDSNYLVFGAGKQSKTLKTW